MPRRRVIAADSRSAEATTTVTAAPWRPAAIRSSATMTPAELLRGGSVNFHISRKCNYACKFCFHTDKTSFVLQLAQQLRAVDRLRGAGVAKLNIAGGEPFLYPDALGQLIQHAKGLGMYTSVRGAAATRCGWPRRWRRCSHQRFRDAHPLARCR